MEAFFKKLAEILEVEAVAAQDELQKFEAWDSLAVLSIIAVLNSDYGIRITASEVNALKTAGEFEAVLARRK